MDPSVSSDSCAADVQRRIASSPLSLRIAGLDISPPLILAPMSGITDSPFRQIVKQLGGCGLVVTELISSEALSRGYQKSQLKLHFSLAERPLSMQIFGGDPERMIQAARMTEEVGADIVDLNLGCPVRKVVKSGAGAHLLRDVVQLGRILERIRGVLQVPLTIKIRAGWDESSINAPEVAHVAEECGVAAVTVHPRTKTQAFSGKADWTVIARTKQRVAIPVIGNGDVRTPQDALRLLADTGCDGIMIGRGILSNPWLIAQSWDALQGRATAPPSAQERWQIFRRYVELASATLDQRVLLDRLKKFSGYFSHEMPNAARLRGDIQQAHSLPQVLERVDRFFSQA